MNVKKAAIDAKDDALIMDAITHGGIALSFLDGERVRLRVLSIEPDNERCVNRLDCGYYRAIKILSRVMLFHKVQSRYKR